jgi:hypothetical protein
LSETDGSIGSPDNGFSNNGSPTEVVTSSDCHALTDAPVELREASKEVPGAAKPPGADARQEVEHP